MNSESVSELSLIWLTIWLAKQVQLWKNGWWQNSLASTIV